MGFEDRVERHFSDSIAAKASALEVLTTPVAVAGELLAQSLAEDKKIVSCGSRGSAVAAVWVATLLLNRFERERPGLPAISLSTELATIQDSTNALQLESVFAKQLRALGLPGDVLIAVAAQEGASEIAQAILAAHAREMRVIALTGSVAGSELEGLLNESDIEIRVPSNSTARIQEVHLLVIHCLCDLIDSHLFGVDEI